MKKINSCRMHSLGRSLLPLEISVITGSLTADLSVPDRFWRNSPCTVEAREIIWPKKKSCKMTDSYTTFEISYDKISDNWIYDGKIIHILYDADPNINCDNNASDGINLKDDFLCIHKNRCTGLPIQRQTVYFPNKSLCVPVRASVSTRTSSSMR